MSEQFLAEAQILILPDTSGFRAALVTELERIEKTAKVQVTAVPSMKGFREALREGVITSSSGVVAKILVRPDMKGFRTALQEQVAAASRGVTASVTPTAARATGRAAAASVATGGVVDKRVAEAQKAITTATDVGIAARRKLSSELTAEEKIVTRVTRAELQLKTANDAVTKSLLTGDAALIAHSESLQRDAVASHAAAIAAQERAATGAPTGIVAKQAAVRDAEKAAEADLLAARRKTAAEFDAIEAKRVAAHAKATTKIEKFYADQVAAAEAAAVKVSAAADKEVAAFERAAAREAAARERIRVKAEKAVETAQVGVKPAPVDVIDPTSGSAAAKRLAAARTEVARADAALAAADREVALAEKAVAAAAKTTDPALRTSAASALSAAEAKQKLAASNLELAETERLLAKQSLKTALAQAAIADDVKRATIAQSAQLVGLRGAALSANAGFIAAAAGVIGFAAAVSSFAKFQSTLNVFNVTAEATAIQMKQVRAEAEALGRDITLPGVGAQDAAEAMTELSKAGLSVEDSIDGARGVLQLATAAAIDNAQATELAASALNAFGLSGNQAVHVADVLTNAANDAQGSIVDIGIALQQAAAVGRQAGLTLEQTTAALTILARSGLRGSDAGTSLRTALIRLINPTAKAQKEIQKLGLQVRTATGAINLDVFDEFARKTRNLTAAQRDQALAIIFGQDAIRAAAIFARAGASAFDQEEASLNKAGSAAKLAGARMAGLAGDVENLKNQLSNLGITIGSVFGGPSSVFVKGFANFTESVDKAIKNLAFGVKTVVGGDTFDEADKNFTELAHKIDDLQGRTGFLKSGAASLGIFGGKGGLSGQDAEDLRESIARLGAEAQKLVREGFINNVLETFIKLSPEVKKAMEDNIITPAEQAALSADPIGREFLKAIPHTAEFFQSFGLAAKDAIEGARAAASEGAPQIAAAIRSTIEDAGAQAKAAAAAAGANLGESLVDGVTNSINFAKNRISNVFSSIGRQARLALGRLQSQALDLEIQDASPQERLKNARAQEKAAQTALDVGTARKDLTRAELDRRKQVLIDAQHLREGIEEEITQNAQDAVSKSKANAQKIEEARNDADQAILDAFTGRRNELDVAATNAAATKSLQDDLKVKVALANQVSKEIGIIDDTVKDQKTRRDQIATRVKELAALGVDITDLRQQIVDNAEEQATTQFETKLSLAQGSGAPLQVLLKIFDRRIADLNKAIEKAKEEKRSTDALRLALQEVTNTRRETFDDFLSKQTELAKATFGDTNNKSPIIKALNREIANKRKEIAQAKKAHKSTLDLRIQLQNLINDRNDILNDAKKADSTQHTTAFDLLKEFNANFSNIAGNIIGPNQPFAGSSAFSTDIVNKAIAGFQQGGLPHRPIDIRLRGDDQQAKQISVTEKLIAVIQENTEVMRGGNRSTQSVFVPGEIEGKNKLAAFWASKTARDVANG